VGTIGGENALHRAQICLARLLLDKPGWCALGSKWCRLGNRRAILRHQDFSAGRFLTDMSFSDQHSAFHFQMLARAWFTSDSCWAKYHRTNPASADNLAAGIGCLLDGDGQTCAFGRVGVVLF
jgi:hypothetical protein